MPRGPRLDAPGCFHHLVGRGVNRRTIFADEVDRRAFLARLAKITSECGLELFAWALLSNHYHLLVRTGPMPIAHAMQRLGTGHARHFNRRHDRVGHLFQGPYHDSLIGSDAHWRVGLRYVLRNPLKHGVVTSPAALERHPWTSLPALLGEPSGPRIERDAVLRRFGGDRREARERVREWVLGPAEEVPTAAPAHAPATATDTVRGDPLHPDSEWIACGLTGMAAPVASRILRLGATSAADREARFESLLRGTCRHFGVDPEAVRAGRRRTAESEARAVIAWLAHDRLGLSFRELGSRLGVSATATSVASRRGPSLIDGESARSLSTPR